MNAIRAFDATGTGTGQQREALVKTAARAVWHYFVQRELCGMRDHRWVINDYGITNEVMARLGASPADRGKVTAVKPKEGPGDFD